MERRHTFQLYTDQKWAELAKLARQQTCHAGFYNDNYRLVHEGKSLLFRFPKKGEEQMDPRPMREGDVYQLISECGLPVPYFYYEAPDREFQVHDFIEGTLVDHLYPPGQKISEPYIEQIASFYKKLAGLNIDVTDMVAHDWPQKGPMLTFFEKLLETSWLIYDNHQATHKNIYQFLNIPDDPFSYFLREAAKLTARPWRLIHADIHRGNMIEREDGKLIIIDWELALYGDLLYCIAAHLHRCRYFPEEKALIAEAIYKKLPENFQTNYMKDLDFYLSYEALKSIITDTVRFPQLLKQKKVSHTGMLELAVYYADNLNRIAPILGTKTTKPEKALQWFEEWMI